MSRSTEKDLEPAYRWDKRIPCVVFIWTNGYALGHEGHCCWRPDEEVCHVPPKESN